MSLYSIISQFPTAVDTFHKNKANDSDEQEDELQEYLRHVQINVPDAWKTIFKNAEVTTILAASALKDEDFTQLANEGIGGNAIPPLSLGARRSLQADWTRLQREEYRKSTTPVTPCPDNQIFTGETSAGYSAYVETSTYIIAEFANRTASSPDGILKILSGEVTPTAHQQTVIQSCLREATSSVAKAWLNAYPEQGIAALRAFISKYSVKDKLDNIKFLEHVQETLNADIQQDELIHNIEMLQTRSALFSFSFTDVILVTLLRKIGERQRSFILDRLIGQTDITITDVIKTFQQCLKTEQYSTGDETILDFEDAGSTLMKVDSAATCHVIHDKSLLSNAVPARRRLTGIGGSTTSEVSGTHDTASIKLRKAALNTNLNQTLISLSQLITSGEIYGAYLTKDHSKLMLSQDKDLRKSVPLQFNRNGWYLDPTKIPEITKNPNKPKYNKNHRNKDNEQKPRHDYNNHGNNGATQPSA